MGWPVKYPHMFIDGVECKRCSCCKQYLPLSMYTNQTRSKDGLATECKPCHKSFTSSEDKKAQRRIYSKQYYEKNKDKISQYVKEYKIKNKDRVDELKKINKEHVCMLRRIRYAMHGGNETKHAYDKKKRAEKDQDYLLARNIAHQKRRTMKRNNISTLTTEEFNECLEYFDYKDAYTGLPMETITQDHIIPLSSGGGYVKWNIVPCDFAINSSKRNHKMETWYKKQSFFSEERLKKIKQWMGYKPNSDILQTAFF